LSAPQRLTPRQLAERIARGDDLQLVDVREPAEWAIGHLEGSVLIPRGELSSRAQELDPQRPVVCICHHGIRSQAAAAFLSRRGFDLVSDLAGGLDRWALEVDPAFPRYGS
jgi:rhodanese-related sulfurtransferase